jgi:hypothetical protein
VLTPEIVSEWDDSVLVVLDPLVEAHYVHQHGKIATASQIVSLSLA